MDPAARVYRGTWELKAVKNYDKTGSKSYTRHFEVNDVRLNQTDTYEYRSGDTLVFRGLQKGSNSKQGAQKRTYQPTDAELARGFSVEFAVSAAKKSGKGSTSWKFTFTWKPAEVISDQAGDTLGDDGVVITAAAKTNPDDTSGKGLQVIYSGYWTVKMTLVSTHHSSCKGHYARRASVDGGATGQNNPRYYESGTSVKLTAKVTDGQGHHPGASKNQTITPTDAQWQQGFTETFNVTMSGGHGGKVVYKATFTWVPAEQ